jgi:aminoglycoside 6-adenylyltransferase
MYQKTYSDGDYEHMWDSIFVACDLFRVLAKDVSNSLSYTYPADDERNMMKYLQHVRKITRRCEGSLLIMEHPKVSRVLIIQ